jgi:predicted XRE-type DNA-binding protein
MSFPNKKTLDLMRKKLSKKQGTLVISPNASKLEKFRWDLCQKFVNFKIKSNLSQKEIAELIGIDEAKISKILRHRIDSFSTDRLITLYEKLDSNLKLKVA